MTMSPRVYKFALVAHIMSSIGWLGAVIAFLALSIVGLTSADGPTVRGVYLVMEPTARFALVPLAVASFLTGVVMSLGTTWGLIRHYWVLFKLLMTLFATGILLMYVTTFREMAAVASDATVSTDAVRNPSPTLHAVLALLLLIITTVLAVYKPRGVTPFGLRTLQDS